MVRISLQVGLIALTALCLFGCSDHSSYHSYPVPSNGSGGSDGSGGSSATTGVETVAPPPDQHRQFTPNAFTTAAFIGQAGTVFLLGNADRLACQRNRQRC